jgi:hypothetical protein
MKNSARFFRNEDESKRAVGSIHNGVVSEAAAPEECPAFRREIHR